MAADNISRYLSDKPQILNKQLNGLLKNQYTSVKKCYTTVTKIKTHSSEETLLVEAVLMVL